MLQKTPYKLILLLSALLVATNSYACPLIGEEEFVDFNCDREFRVTMTGDSIVKGVGDDLNDGKGGYVRRLNLLFGGGGTGVRFFNLGVPGITSGRLLREFKKNLNRPSARITNRRTKDVDLVVIDVGRNDYFQEQPASFTVRNIRRVVKTLKKELGRRGVQPFVVVSTLIPTNRGFQQPFVDEVNSQLIRFRSKNLPTFIRLDRSFPRSLLSDDNLHPSSRGYDRLSLLMSRFVRKKVQKKMLLQRPDGDNDSVFDIFESSTFGTDPLLLDTDNDSFSDGDELFVLESDPLDPLDPVDPNAEVDEAEDSDSETE